MMADACSSSSSEQESDSNESFGQPLRMDFRALLATHLKMIHELGAVNQQRNAENRNGTKVLKVRRVVCKPNVATIYSAHFH